MITPGPSPGFQRQLQAWSYQYPWLYWVVSWHQREGMRLTNCWMLKGQKLTARLCLIGSGVWRNSSKAVPSDAAFGERMWKLGIGWNSVLDLSNGGSFQQLVLVVIMHRITSEAIVASRPDGGDDLKIAVCNGQTWLNLSKLESTT